MYSISKFAHKYDYYDSKWAEDRLARNTGNNHSMQEIAMKAGITEKDLEAASDVEIE